MEFIKGGKGKKAPYTTVHYRIPEPIKPVVERLANAYKTLLSYERNADELLTKVDETINSSVYPSDEKVVPTIRQDTSALEARIAQLERQLAKEAADAQKYYPGWRKLPGLESELRFNRSKRAELEADNELLIESLAAKERELELFKTFASDAGCTQKALELLDKYLGEAGIPLDDKGKPKARYDQLAKFKSWLEHQ